MDCNQFEHEKENRMKILMKLGMQKKVDRRFVKNTEYPMITIMFRLGSVYADVVTDISFHSEFWDIKKAFEEDYDAIVYYGIYSIEDGDENLAFLYLIKDDEKMWESEKKVLQEGCPLAYIYNLTKRYDDIQKIKISIRDGVLIRVNT